MKKKILISVSAIVIIFVSLTVVNFLSNEKVDQEAINRSLSSKTVNSNQVDEKEQRLKKEFEEDMKQLVASQFDYFDSIINGDFFYQSRNNQSVDNFSDAWLTENVKEELHEHALEIHQLLPEELDENDPNSQKLLQVLIGINLATSAKESQKNIYSIYKTLYELNVQLNDYELNEFDSNGRERFNPEDDWMTVFGEQEDQSVKTEAELKEKLSDDPEVLGENE
ncbi:hypothetical protein [Metabacillus litoralis]|uniref:hypothetical protein n=1 Tax=Metabacillus litoralis TaxID=152268 RepID=UPI001CFE19B9|nr:hypothetical protein [Metabacillus litoralis]